MSAHDFLINLALVLGVASIAAAVCRALRQPAIVGYLLAGLIVGPHTATSLLADVSIVTTLSELGVILLMFCLGLEFSARALIRVAPRAGPTALVEMSLTGWLGFTGGQILGWDTISCVFAGVMVAISSTMVIARTFDDQQQRGPFTDLVYGVLIFQDLAAIVAITALSAIATGAGAASGVLSQTLLHLGAFLLGVLLFAVPVVPRLVRAVSRLGSQDTTLVFAVGLCFAMALLARKAGFSVALGAFIAGSLVAESGEGHHIQKMVSPLRDLFSAIFFVSVGMLVELARIPDNLGAIAVITGVVIVGKLVGVTVGAVLAGNPLRRSIRSAMSLAQIGEFSFIVAGIGVAYGVISPDVLVVAVTVSVLTTFLTPWLVNASDRTARAADRRLPRPLGTLITLYGSWLEMLRKGPRSGPGWGDIRRLTRRLVLDAVALWGVALTAEVAVRYLPSVFVTTAALALATPLVLGLLRTTVRLATRIAQHTLPLVAPDRADLVGAPRRAFIVALETAVMAVVGLPLVALVQPTLPAWALLPVVLLLTASVGYVLWNTSKNLDGHLQAGSEVVLEALARSLPTSHLDPAPPDRALREVEQLLPGLGNITPLRISAAWWACGRTVAEVEVRGTCSATPVALQRRDAGIANPGPDETLRAGDVLVVVGSAEATAFTRSFLEAGPPASIAA